MNNDINAWLDHLQILFEPTGILLVGAGTGTGDWVRRVAQWDIANVTLVEADEAQFERLHCSFAERDGWRIRSDVVASGSRTVTYHRASNAAESGLLEPESLRNLWPNIKTEEKQPRQAIALSALLNGASVNWLLVDCLPALPIIQSAESLDSVEIVAARVLLQESDQDVSSATLAALDAYLCTQNFRLVHVDSERHPAVGCALFVRDLQATVQQLIEQKRDAFESLEAAARGNFERVEKIANENRELARKLDHLLKDHVTANQTLSMYREQLGDLRHCLEEFGGIKQALTTSLQNALVTAAKHTNAFLEVQNYLSTGNLTGKMDSWAICPELALLIIELLERNQYDLVIEFGSGTSTCVIAKTLQHIDRRKKKTGKTVQLAFEHLDYYFDETSASLRQAGLENSVGLHLSPLSPYVGPNSTTYSFYSCHETLKAVAKNFSFESRILVLVDGPPGITCKHARFPALPCVLEAFQRPCMDILLDDYDRAEEQEVVNMWKESLCSAGYTPNISIKKMEKDACLISVL